MSQCYLLHFFPHTTLHLSIQSAVCNPHFMFSVLLSQCYLLKFLPHATLPHSIHWGVCNPQFMCSVLLSPCYLIHFFPHNTLPLSIHSAVCNSHFMCSVLCHSAIYFTSSLTLHFPPPSSQLFVNHTLSALFLVKMLLTSILPSQYPSPLHPVICL